MKTRRGFLSALFGVGLVAGAEPIEEKKESGLIRLYFATEEGEIKGVRPSGDLETIYDGRAGRAVHIAAARQ